MQIYWNPEDEAGIMQCTQGWSLQNHDPPCVFLFYECVSDESNGVKPQLRTTSREFEKFLKELTLWH